MSELLTRHGSFRRVMEAYWFRQLSHADERTIENQVPKEVIIGFKPVSTPNPEG